MSQTVVGTGVVNFDTKAALVFPSLTLARGRAYFFFINTVPTPVFSNRQYLLLFARYTSGTFTHESKLLAKFFSNGPRMMFVVPVPDLSFVANSYGVQVIARPSELFLGAGAARTATVRLEWDDAKNLNTLASSL